MDFLIFSSLYHDDSCFVWSEGLNWDFWTQIELALRMEIWLYPLNYRWWIDEIPQRHVQGRKRFFVAAGIGRKSKFLRTESREFINAQAIEWISLVRTESLSARSAKKTSGYVWTKRLCIESKQHSNEMNGKYEETCCIYFPLQAATTTNLCVSRKTEKRFRARLYLFIFLFWQRTWMTMMIQCQPIPRFPSCDFRSRSPQDALADVNVWTSFRAENWMNVKKFPPCSLFPPRSSVFLKNTSRLI